MKSPAFVSPLPLNCISLEDAEQGFTLALMPDYSAHLKTSAGEITELVYRLMFTSTTGRSFYILHQPNLKPADTVATILWFHHLATDGAKISIRRYGSGIDDFPEPGSWWARDNERALEAIAEGSVPVGFGERRLAFLTPDGQVAVIGPLLHRLPCPYLLRPTRRAVFGYSQVEWFPFAETRSITAADIAHVRKLMESDGWFCCDWKTANVGRLADGTLVRIDPDDLEYIEQD